MSLSHTGITSAAFGRFLALSGGFWRGPGRLRTWGLTLVVLAATLAQIGVGVGVNAWNRYFFDALEKKDVSAVWSVLAWLPLIVLVTALVISILVVSRMLFQVRWRAWLTDHLMGWWVADQRYYRLGFIAPDLGAPEFRIAEDVRLAVEPLVEFALGFLSALITAATFAAILWQVAGSYTVSIGGADYEIPAYMAVAAVLYAVVTSCAAYFAGRPLVGRISDKNEAEAVFRAEMTRLRENSESIALIRGCEDELESLRGKYGAVVSAWLKIVAQQGRIALVLNTNGALFPVIPLLLTAPKYLSGHLTLGAVMQVVAAFTAVQGALIWFVDNFVRLAEWYASASRVIALTTALNELDVGTVMEAETSIQVQDSPDGQIHIENLSVADRGGRVVINGASTSIAPGEKVLIGGESGSGKSTLIRAVAGLWPWGSGSIRLPRDVTIAFVPQRPYLPIGTLREALLYPDADATLPEAQIAAAMSRCGLGYLVRRLDEAGVRWDETLSGGERQRVAFCRLLLQKPQIIIMDEATSALDEDSQVSLLALLQEDLAQSTVISVGHRPGIEEFHDRKIVLEKKLAGAEMRQHALPKSLWRLLPFGRLFGQS